MREPAVRHETAAEEAEPQRALAPSPASGAFVAGADLPTVLGRAISLLRRLGGDFSGGAQRLEELADRLAQGRFHLAVLGQFKRGKSTLLNALLGEPVLPTSVVPLTAIPTFIHPGRDLRASVLFQDDRQAEGLTASGVEELNAFLARFVTENGNPKNGLGVLQVEVTHPADILRKGVVLIDTPGIGSTFRHNTEATLNFLPQCDAALFLVSADPPMTEVEVEFLKQVRTKVPRLFFIFNKADYLNPSDRQAALEFLRKVLTEQAGIAADAAVFCVSARQALEARLAGNTELWRRSGLANVERHLVEFLASEKSKALHEAVSRKAADVVADVLMRLRLSIRSMQMPLEELQQRFGIFEEKIAEAQRERHVANDLLTGDRKRMHEFLEEQSEALRRKAAAYLKGVVKEASAGNGGQDEEAIRERLAAVIPGFFEHHMGQMTSLFGKRIGEALLPHQRRADALIESVRRAAADLFEIPYQAPESAGAFEMVQEPYWVTHQWTSTVSLIPPGFIDRFLPEGLRKARMMKRLKEQIGGLVIRNVENLRWAIYQSLDQTFTRFGSSLDERLAATIEATHGAIRAAIDRRRQQSEAVSPEVSRLETAVDGLAQVQAALGKG